MVEIIETKNRKTLSISDRESINRDDVSKYKMANIVQLNIQRVNEIGATAFKNWKSLKFVYLTDVESITSMAFADCEKLEEVKFGNKLNNVHFRAFSNCERLKELIFPETITHIRERAFEGCSSLRKIDLSLGIEYVGHRAFASAVTDDVPSYSCDAKINSIRLANTIEIIDSDAFFGKHINYLEIPVGTRKHATGAFNGAIIDRAEIFLESDDSLFNEFEDYLIPDIEFLWDLLSKEEVL